jgi:hypothetical protein
MNGALDLPSISSRFLHQVIEHGEEVRSAEMFVWVVWKVRLIQSSQRWFGWRTAVRGRAACLVQSIQFQRQVLKETADDSQACSRPAKRGAWGGSRMRGRRSPSMLDARTHLPRHGTGAVGLWPMSADEPDRAIALAPGWPMLAAIGPMCWSSAPVARGDRELRSCIEAGAAVVSNRRIKGGATRSAPS